MKILIIGGSRFVGPVLINSLLEGSHEVKVFNRGTRDINYPNGVTFVKGDRTQGFAAIKDHFDVVIDMCAFNGQDTKKAIDELTFDHFVHFSTVAVYKKSEIFPLTEDAELGELPAAGDYNRGKVECEEVLASSSIRYATIRPDYILGPNNYLDRENFIYQKVYNDEEIVLPGNGQAMCQFVFVDEVAEIIKKIVEEQLTGAFNVAGDEFVTLKGFVEILASIVGKQANIVYNPEADGEHHNPEQFPFVNDNLITSNMKLKNLGFTIRALKDGLQSDYDSYYKELQK